ncbi:MAG: type II secretion system F family protein [Scytolyngbya sp. HA4215-MV1]|nr:type II secretion system F family protein [Scytolyngbya sp. HA4215-MV1]
MALDSLIEKTQFLYQFATLLNTGFSVQQSLTLAGQNCNASFRQRLQQANRQVDQGQDLSSALAAPPAVFDDWTLTLLRIAEQSGALAEICHQLALADDRHHRHSRLYFSLGFSVIVIILGLLALPILLLHESDNFLSHPIVWLLGIFLLGLLLAIANQFPSFPFRNEKVQQELSNLPIVGQIIQARSMLHLAELALPLKCGLSLLVAVELIHDQVPDLLLRSKLQIALHHLRLGTPLSQSLQGKLPAIALQLIRTGEETGNLDDKLQQMSEYYSRELDQLLHICQSVLKPISILVTGAVVVLLGVQTLTTLSNALPK